MISVDKPELQLPEIWPGDMSGRLVSSASTVNGLRYHGSIRLIGISQSQHPPPEPIEGAPSPPTAPLKSQIEADSATESEDDAQALPKMQSADSARAFKGTPGSRSPSAGRSVHASGSQSMHPSRKASPLAIETKQSQGVLSDSDSSPL